MKRTTFSAILAAVSILSAQAGPVPAPTIQTIPANGSLQGMPGSVVGWGFTLQYNAPVDWVVLNGSNFTGSTAYGTYDDYIGSQFVVAGPAPESSSITESWVLGVSGLGDFVINNAAPVGAQISGDINVDYSIFSQDPNSPNFDPDTATVVASATAFLPVSLTIEGEPQTAVPEPDLLLLTLAVGIAGVAALRHRPQTT